MKFTTIHEDLNGIESYWSDFNRNLYWPCVFVLPAWLKVWWRSFRPDAESYIRVVKNGGNVIGIAPLMLREKTAFLIGNTDVCDYLDFITAPGQEDGFFGTLLDDLKRDGVQLLDLKDVREDSAVRRHLVPLAAKRRYEVIETRENVTVEMRLPATFEQYMDTLDSKQRHEVRRKMRRIAEAGNVSFRFVDDNPGVMAVLDIFFNMFVESRSDKADFLTAQMSKYFRSLADALSTIKILKMGVLELDGKAVAEIMCFDYSNGIFLYNSGYDPEYNSLSAGLLSKVFAIRDSIEKGRKTFDFLKGSETYKFNLGGKEVPLYRCQIVINK